MTTKTPKGKAFGAMATAYCLGVFNDNFFKQAAMLLAVAAGLNHLQGWAAILFALPFIIFAAQGGWCADRFPKKKMIVLSKSLEIGAMLVGGIGLVTGNWPCILGMVFLMGLQSTFFGPALNGSIPELYPPEFVPKTNAILKLVTTLAILAGIATAGLSLDQNWFQPATLPAGPALVAALTIIVSIIGFLASLGIRQSSIKNTPKPFPWFGPLNSLKDLIEISRDRHLLLAIIADTWFYFLASIAVLVINAMGLQQFGFSQTKTSLLPVSLMVGVCAGSFLAAKLVKIEKWSSHLVPAASIMSAALISTGITPLIPANSQFGWLVTSLFITGTGGGLFLIPVTSILQVRPASREKGKVLAAAGFTSFCAIMASGVLFNLVEPYFKPSSFMTALGIATLLFIIVLRKALSADNLMTKVIGAALRRILSLRYRVHVSGLEEIAAQGKQKIIFLPNHPALIDPVIVMSQIMGDFSPRPLSSIDQINKPIIRTITAPIRPITIPDVRKSGKSSKQKVHEAIDQVVTNLKQNENILFYPAGRLYRDSSEDLGSNSGVEHILSRVPDARVVLVRTGGLWGSSFSRATGDTPSVFKKTWLYLRSLLANGFFLGPRREVSIEFMEDNTVATLKERARINRYLEAWYNKIEKPNTYVPYFWWQGSKPQVRPEVNRIKVTMDTSNIPATMQQEIIDHIQALAGTDASPGLSLARDLGLDSLTIMELGTWIENEYGVSIPNIESLETVNDCFLAATGSSNHATEQPLQTPPQGWFRNDKGKLTLPAGQNITDAFLRQARRAPGKTIIADTMTGSKTYRQIITAIFALQPILRQLKGERIGIMLPASTTSSIIYMASLFSGKTPVLFNWTAGIGNLRYGVEDTGVTTILTASALYKKIEEQQDIDLSSLPVDWLHLDQLLPKIKKTAKIAALLKSYFCPYLLQQSVVKDTAAILFTSGSESRPKPVPLSHGNIIANLNDFSGLLDLDSESRLLGILPPFHSLGLAGTIIMPLCLGLKTVYYPNPTEPVILANIIKTYKASMLVATPTFLNGILQAGNSDQLSSLRLVFTGAEKCPEKVRHDLSAKNPLAELCEGYGITECSPLVSINIPGASRPNTIGRILPSIEHVIVDENINSKVESGCQGLLLVRGPNIFSGYLGSAPEKGFCHFAGKTWYNTGDYVTQEEDGHLVFRGRKKRFIKIGGEMISLPAIENALITGLNIEGNGSVPLAVEATSDESHPEIILFSTEPLDRNFVNNKLKQAGLSGLHNIRRLIQVDDIPVLGSGKTDYQQLKAKLAA